MTKLSSDELDIINACLNAWDFGDCPTISDATNPTSITSQDRDYLWETFSFIRQENMLDLENDTCESYISNNSEVVYFDQSFQDKHNVILLPDNEYQEYLDDLEYGPKIRSKFPLSKGLLHFSRPGFNKNKTQALIYYGHFFDILRAEGVFELYNLSGSVWNRSESTTIWVS